MPTPERPRLIGGAETDTVFLNQQSRPALRALRTGRTAELAPQGEINVMENMAGIQSLYFGGDMEAAIPLCGQVCGGIEDIRSAKDIIEETMVGFRESIHGLSEQYTG